MHRRLFLFATLLLSVIATVAPRVLPAQDHAQAELTADFSPCVRRPALPSLDADRALHHTVTRPDTAHVFRCISAAKYTALRPDVQYLSRSGVPDARGSGAATPGIGTSFHVRGGLDAQYGLVLIRIAPEITWASNADYQIFPGRDSTRSSFASPFYHGAHSADLPSRFGDQDLLRFALGESGVWIIRDRWHVAATSSLPDWGPGVGESIVLGRTASGVPRLEASTRQPTPFGTFGAQWFAGAATESRFFDADAANNIRPMGGVRLTFDRESFAIGASRTVMDGRADRSPLAALWHPLSRIATDSVIEFVATDLLLRNADAGTFAWIELARQAPLTSMRDFLLLPTEGLALRLGFSQRLVQGPTASWTLALEAVRLDQPAQRTDRPQQDLYTSPVVVHGWTHHGESLGSGIGPGGQRQYLSLDRHGAVWEIGGFAERVRWNDDAHYREYLAYPVRHDVTVQLGGRAARRWRDFDLAITLSAGTRLNYLFQNADFIPSYRTVDARSAQFGLTLTPIR